MNSVTISSSAKPTRDNLADILGLVGYVAAPIIVRYIDWARKMAEYPVKIAFCDGEIISRVARRLAAIPGGGYDDLVGWEDVYLTRATTKCLDLGTGIPNAPEIMDEYALLMKYLEQTGTDRPFTMLDTGYIGTIVQKFQAAGIKCQPLFICSDNSEIPAFLDMDGVFDTLKAARISSMGMKERLKSFCFSFLEELPKSTLSPDELVELRDGRVAPKLTPIHPAGMELYRMFYAGLDMYMDDMAAGRAAPMSTAQCIELVFRTDSEMQIIASGLTVSDARFNRKFADIKSAEAENIRNAYMDISGRRVSSASLGMQK
jgi:hypothetical protein